jgi:hypothetical protein
MTGPIDEHVLRLDVSVHNACDAVQVEHAGTELGTQAQHQRQVDPSDQLPQVSSVNVFHDEAGPATDPGSQVRRDHVRSPLDRLNNLGLSDE